MRYARLVGQEVSIERAAALLELDATEVRRLTKLAAGKSSVYLKPFASRTAPADLRHTRQCHAPSQLIPTTLTWPLG